MSTNVVLGMDDATADIFREQLMSYSDKLNVVENIPIFHNAQRALKMLNPTPDVFLISANHMRYDGTDYKKELLRGLLNLKMDKQTNRIRLAVQVDALPTDPFLRSLALVQVDDIFSGTSQNPAEFNMAQVAKQLSASPNIKNIYRYLNLNQPIDQISNLGEVSSGVASSDNGRVKQLEKLVKVLKQQRDDLQEQVGVNSVPKQDYDDVINELKKIMNSGLTDEKFQALFKKLVNINENQQSKMEQLTAVNEKLNNSVVDLNSQLSAYEDSFTDNGETERLRRENSMLKQKVAMNNRTTQPVTRKPRISTTQNRGAPRKTYASSQESGSSVGKIIVVLVAAFGLLFGGVFIYRHISHNNEQQTQVDQKPPYSKLIKAGNYDTAAKYYPSKAVKAENAMMADKNLSAKGTMAERIGKYSNNDVIKFDIAYFNGNYQDAVDLYKNSPSPDLTSLSKERRVMAAYSLMKIGSISEAKQVASPLDNEKLNQRIAVYGKFYNANKILNNKIQNGHLSKKEEEKAKQQIKENQEAMDKL